MKQSRAKKLIQEAKSQKLPKKGDKIKFTKNNFRLKGESGVISNVDNPTGDLEDVLVKIKVGDKEVEAGLGELEKFKDLI